MTYDPEKHHRRSIRLKDYDYSQAGAYFLTICTYNRECTLGDVVDGVIVLNDFGKIVESVWSDLPKHYSDVRLDAFIIMPNHVHSIIFIVGANVRAGFKPAPTTNKRHPLSELVRGFKTFSSRCVNEIRGLSGTPVWQRNYYEHIIRNEKDLNEIREYIVNNPTKWEMDEENPRNIKVGAGLKPAPTGKFKQYGE